MDLTYKAVQENPQLLETLMVEARRERAKAVHRLLVAPIRRLFSGDAAKSRCFGHSATA